MWKTVDDFEKDGGNVPQFYGKWPFVRVLGVQEPASAVFSVLNLLSHVAMLMYFRARVPSAAPLFLVWHFYSLSNVNAWLWSTVFHVRDTNFTEMMDYFSAIFMVLTSLFAVCVRVPAAQHRRRVGCCAGAVLLCFFIYHVHYLAFVSFDYNYNMKANVIAGLLNAAGWVWWSWRVRKRQRYVWKAVVSIVWLSTMLLLELLDFPPLGWTLDAHSLWHLGTILIPVLWYRFLVADCLYEVDHSAGDLPKTKLN